MTKTDEIKNVPTVETATEASAGTSETETTLQLSKTYDFEGKKISSLDLSGVIELSTDTMIEIENRLAPTAPLKNPILTELDLSHTLMVASYATGLPYEFFLTLRLRDGLAVKNSVTGFIVGSD